MKLDELNITTFGLPYPNRVKTDTQIPGKSQGHAKISGNSQG